MTRTIDLEGRRVLVTGAAGALGGAVAAYLERSGARVAGVDREDGDVADEADAGRLVDAAAERLGGLDGLVTAAGIAGDYVRSTDQPLDEWQRVLDVNLRGTFAVARAAGRHMVPRRSGSIVTLGSIAGIAGFPSSNSYAVSKAGVAMLTRTLSGEWARSGVRVNCVSPGVIDAGLFDETISTIGPEAREGYLARIPAGRLGTPRDVVGAVAFLLSDLAAYITGVELAVDGGWTANNGPAR